MTEGAVLFHKNFSFHDGGVADKLLILLNTPLTGEPYICCKTTTHCKHMINKEGCHSHKNIYKLNADFDWFKLDTWIQFDIYELTAAAILKACMEKNTCYQMHQLREQTIKAIKNA